MPLLRERSGRLSPPKIAAFLAAIGPIAWLAIEVVTDDLGPKPLTEAIHQTGHWAVRLLLLTLAISPMRRIFDYNRLVLARRTLGVAVACYAGFHLCLYVADQAFALTTVASEIVLRIYLTIGFVTLVGLIALAVTSTDAAIRRMGAKRWNALHDIVYGLGVLALIHFFLQSKINVDEPVLMSGLFLWLLGYRALHRLFGPVTLARLALLAIGAGLATALGEAAWYALATGVDARLVLAANLDFTYSIRPAWWVFGAGAAVAAAAFARRGLLVIPAKAGIQRAANPDAKRRLRPGSPLSRG
jgi:sulfoxide reductase heme-binding subunit YedZ